MEDYPHTNDLVRIEQSANPRIFQGGTVANSAVQALVFRIIVRQHFQTGREELGYGRRHVARKLRLIINGAVFEVDSEPIAAFHINANVGRERSQKPLCLLSNFPKLCHWGTMPPLINDKADLQAGHAAKRNRGFSKSAIGGFYGRRLLHAIVLRFTFVMKVN